MFFQPIYYPEAMSSQDKVTISGVVFHVEDTCRSMLNDYLKSFQQKQKDAWCEERLAELLLEELNEVGKQIVTEEQVHHLIQ